MSKLKLVLTLFALVLISSVSRAQVITNLELTNVVDSKPVSLKGLSSNYVVVIFFSNNCPFDAYYLERIKLLQKEFTGKAQVILINSSLEEGENVKNMNAFIQANGLSIPYLADKEQVAANQLNPRKTPEAFILQSAGEKFTVMYRGSIDDNPQAASEVTTHYLKDALNNLIGGKKVEVKDVRPVGCSIKKG